MESFYNASKNVSTIPTNETFTTQCFSTFCRFTLTERAAIAFAFSVPFVMTLIGNILISGLILMNKHLRASSTSMAILNLSVCDLLMGTLCMPVVIIDTYLVEHWFFDEFMCKLVSYVQKVALSASMLNLALISFQKYIAICFPLKFRISKKHTKFGILVVWIIALAEPIPLLFVQKVITYTVQGQQIKVCSEDWSSENSTIYTIVHIIVMYFVPLIAMSVFSVLTAKGLSKPFSKTFQKNIPKSVQSMRLQAVRILKYMVFSFILFWTPYHALALADALSHNLDIDVVIPVYPICVWMMFFGSACHPIVYGFFGSKYRQALKEVFQTTGIFRGGESAGINTLKTKPKELK